MGRKLQMAGKKKFKYCVFGNGMGATIAYHLMHEHDTEVVYLSDIEYAQARKTTQRLTFLADPSAAQCIPMKYASGDNIEPNFFKQFDVIISALPAKYNLPLAEFAIANGIHYCDLGGVLSVTQDIVKAAEGKDLHSSIITDCGLMPGRDMIIARKLIDLVRIVPNEPIEELTIYVGGIPQKPHPPLYYDRVYSTAGLKHICFDPVYVLRNGEIVVDEPFSEYGVTVIPSLAKFSPNKDGEVEFFNTAGSSIAPWTFQKLGVRNFSEKTIRWRRFVDFVRSIPPENFERDIESHINRPINKDNPDLVWTRVVAKSNSGHIEMDLLDLFDPKTGFTAMQRSTGFSAAIVAEMAARGELKNGCFTPDEAMTSEVLDSYFQKIKKIFINNMSASFK